MTVTECCRRIHRGTWPCARAAACAVASVAALLAAGPPASAQCQYEVTAIIDIRNCDIGDSSTFGQAMNNNAEVVGFYRICAIGNDRAFFWSQQTGFITLPHPPGVVRSWAYDISDNRIIVGQHEFTGIGRKGFVYDMKTNEYQHLEPLHDGVSAVNVSSANAVNNSGVVAGMRSISKTGGTPFNAVIWRPFEKGSPVEDLGVMNGPNSWASDINDAGQASGSTGVQFTANSEGWIRLNDEPILLGPIPCGSSSGAIGISSDGTVASGGHLLPRCGPAASQGALWHDGKWELLPLPPNTTGGSALAINDLRQATGRVLLTTGGERGAMWQHGKIHLLPDLLAPGQSLFPIEQSRAVNNAGQILVRVSTRAAILTPINVPFADLNFDCAVDVYDLLIFLNHWGPVSKGAPTGGSSGIPLADLNGDGVVDVIDLFILLENWNP